LLLLFFDVFDCLWVREQEGGRVGKRKDGKGSHTSLIACLLVFMHCDKLNSKFVSSDTERSEWKGWKKTQKENKKNRKKEKK